MKKMPIIAGITVIVLIVLALTLGRHKNASAPGATIKTLSGADAKKAEKDAVALPVPTNSVSIVDTALVPINITIPLGSTVIWSNNDNTAHTIIADDGSFNSESIASKANFTHTFATVGTFKYHCDLHPNMTGSVTVRPQ